LQQVQFAPIDLSNYAAVLEALGGWHCDGVVHLAALPNPLHFPIQEVYANNTVSSYNVLLACAELGIHKVCQASSINAIGGAFSRKGKYDYFPVDEKHASYNEDAYSLSKWVLEAQGDSIARRHRDMTICSLRFHGLVPEKPNRDDRLDAPVIVNHLWGYTDIRSAAKACALALLAPWKGHEAFFITAPTTCVSTPSLVLAQRFYMDVAVRGDLSGQNSFYNAAKAEHLLGWRHEDFEK
jgi:UDP-glucose 4-epimerase